MRRGRQRRRESWFASNRHDNRMTCPKHCDRTEVDTERNPFCMAHSIKRCPTSAACPLDGEFEELALLNPRDLALLLIDRQFELPVQIRAGAGFNALARAFALAQNQRVVGIPHEAVAASVPLP